ncbi:hypothetical protein [Streptomyces sp. NRRL F-5630]|uniref:hypothetical protein n=1 Tax=Streptomyces sp. NRRL F-5630 TaxID=1463864 RepID=UPI003D761690
MAQPLGHDPLCKPQWQDLFVEPAWPAPAETAGAEEEYEVAAGLTASPRGGAPRGHARRRGA